jgi:hypothetical protein
MLYRGGWGRRADRDFDDETQLEHEVRIVKRSNVLSVGAIEPAACFVWAMVAIPFSPAAGPVAGRGGPVHQEFDRPGVAQALVTRNENEPVSSP